MVRASEAGAGQHERWGNSFVLDFSRIRLSNHYLQSDQTIKQHSLNTFTHGHECIGLVFTVPAWILAGRHYRADWVLTWGFLQNSLHLQGFMGMSDKQVFNLLTHRGCSECEPAGLRG